VLAFPDLQLRGDSSVMVRNNITFRLLLVLAAFTDSAAVHGGAATLGTSLGTTSGRRQKRNMYNGNVCDSCGDCRGRSTLWLVQGVNDEPLLLGLCPHTFSLTSYHASVISTSAGRDFRARSFPVFATTIFQTVTPFVLCYGGMARLHCEAGRSKQRVMHRS
jgi:hypothetical protein